MSEPNGGSAEYQNIIGNLDNIGNLLEEELLNKKAEESEVREPLDGMAGLLIPLVGMVATTPTMVIKNNIVPFTRAKEISTAAQLADDAVIAVKNAIPSMTQGGIRSVINLATKFGPLLLRVLGVVGAIAFAVYETYNTFSTIGNEFSQLYERVVELETELGKTKAQVQKANQRIDDANRNINNFQTGLINLEKFTNQNISELKRKVKGLEELIKKNHAQSMGEFEKVQTKLDVEFLLNKDWQKNNGAEAVATLAAAATISQVERPGGLTKKAADMAEAAVSMAEEAKNSADDAGNIGKGNGKKIDDMAEGMKKKFQRISQMFDIGIIIDLVTMITSLHNAALLSRDILGTCVQVLESGVNAALNMFGYKNVDDEGIDVSKILSDSFDNLGKAVLGTANWEILKGQWAAANRITAAANSILWATREIAETTNSLAQSAAENTGKLGNRLIASGVLDDIGRYFPENYSMRSRLGRKMAEATGFLQGVQNTAQGFEQFTSEVLSIQGNIKEIQENSKEIAEAMEKLEPKRTPNNDKVLEQLIAENLSMESPIIKLEDLAAAPKED